jgi:hypothetical protein
LGVVSLQVQGRVLHEVEVEICEREEVTCGGDGEEGGGDGEEGGGDGTEPRVDTQGIIIQNY